MQHQILMIGAGGMADAWINVFLPEFTQQCRIVGLVDVDQAILERNGRRLGLWPHYCFPEMGAAFSAVQAGQVNADCAIVVIPPQFHRQAIAGALTAGLHVLTEKPLAGSWPDCLAIARAVAGSSLKVAVMQNYRHNPAIRAARQALASRVVGEPYFVSATFRADYRAFGSWAGPWRHGISSPVLNEAAIHHLDQIRYLTSLDFEEVAGDEWKPEFVDSFAGACCVSLLARLKGGVRVMYEANVVCASEERSWTNEEYRIECSDGALVVFGESLRIERNTSDGLRVEPVATSAMARTYHPAAIAEFLHWLDGGPAPSALVSDNLRSMRALFAAMRAVERRSWTRVGPDGDEEA